MHSDKDLAQLKINKSTLKTIKIKLMALVVKNPPANVGDVRDSSWVQSLGQEDSLEEDMATHSSIVAWRIPWTEEFSRLQSIGSQRVRHD